MYIYSLSQASDNEKLKDQQMMAQRLYKGIKTTTTDFEWMDTLLCRQVMLNGQFEILRREHDIHVIDILKTKPYWTNLKAELRKDVHELDYDSSDDAAENESQ